MNKTWLLIDAPYLCWRAFHSTGHLSHGGLATGITFGFLRDVQKLMDQHATQDIAFCFDVGLSKRKTIYPAYKAKREKTEEEQILRSEVYTQIDLIRTKYLPALGFKNVFHQEGYEADDLIAMLTEQVKEGNEILIVSADHDLYQLLGPNVWVWHPRENKVFGVMELRNKYGVTPKEWIEVKAIAGCDSDNIKGIEGVAEKTACKYVTGKLKATTKTFWKIGRGIKTIQRNRELVTLPFPGTEEMVLQEDETSPKKWRKVLDELGIRSLKGATQ